MSLRCALKEEDVEGSTWSLHIPKNQFQFSAGISFIHSSSTSLFFTQCLCSSLSVKIFQMPKQTRHVFWVSDVPFSGWNRAVPNACCSVPSAQQLAEATCSCLSILPFQSINAIFCSESAWRHIFFLTGKKPKPWRSSISGFVTFLQQIMIMKYTFSFFGAAWKGIIGEIKHCAFKVYFL